MRYNRPRLVVDIDIQEVLLYLTVVAFREVVTLQRLTV
jgi:hypothetical protein